ncbi:DUF3397 family protein [Virgibacillus sp. NKC19-3]|uniref:DUF3397 domain-containing protein n=1 Tax=Virgibacillus saliphilus TaxID=2831674 RepID=UPI001C9BA264|nr:DUF3397 family protein [Virgibacillus sp. NKC19-3]
MGNIIIYFIAFFITFPFLATMIIYKISLKLYGHPWKAIHISVSWTTVFYMVAVLILVSNIFDREFSGILLILLLSMLAGIIFLQWKMRTEIILTKALKILWRLCFLLFSFSYICFVLIGIVQRIIV